jgi:hypothetical protein
MESPGVYHIVVCIGPTAHVDLDRLQAQRGLAFYQVQEECRRPRRGDRYGAPGSLALLDMSGVSREECCRLEIPGAMPTSRS